MRPAKLTDPAGEETTGSPGEQFSHLTRRLFINAPFERLQQDLLKVFIDNRLQPEIGLEGDCLYENNEEDFLKIARALKKAGLACTIHAPFCDLAPGASDKGVLEATRNKLLRAFDLIEIFEPVAIVCHLGYEANKHSYRQEEWLTNSVETWQEMLIVAEQNQTTINLENTYETGPDQHLEILSRLDSPLVRFCLDVGHVMSFAGNTWQEWLTPLAPWLGQLHLHDNLGDGDHHLAIGDGNFDFSGLFSFLRNHGYRPVITLEPHIEEGLWESLRALENMVLPEPP
jgi:sugar phosphate isomerase/epimerase